MQESFESYLSRNGHRPSRSVDTLFEVMLGALFARALNVGEEGADDFATEVAAIAMAALR